jgi:hypothetical protein
MKLVYAGIHCTFYNITSEIGNNKFGIEDKFLALKYLTIPDGFYDLKSFNREFMSQLSEMGLNRHGIRFGFQETSGKILIHFQIRGKSAYMLTLGHYNNDLLGFNLPGDVHIILPQKDQNPAVGDKPINFRPFEYFHVHCDLIDSGNVLYNGKRSDIFATLPIKESDFGELIQCNLADVKSKKCDKCFNKLRIWVADENDNPIDFNGANIQYEILFFEIK